MFTLHDSVRRIRVAPRKRPVSGPEFERVNVNLIPVTPTVPIST